MKWILMNNKLWKEFFFFLFKRKDFEINIWIEKKIFNNFLKSKNKWNEIWNRLNKD
jgi:hypothetical protein